MGFNGYKLTLLFGITISKGQAHNRPIAQFRDAPVPSPTMNHFVTEMYICVLISVSKCCIVRYLSTAVGFVSWFYLYHWEERAIDSNFFQLCRMAIWRYKTWSALIQVLVCRLFCAKSLSELVLTYRQLDPIVNRTNFNDMMTSWYMRWKHFSRYNERTSSLSLLYLINTISITWIKFNLSMDE